MQVINEFTSVARRKLGRSWLEIEASIGDVLAVVATPLPVTLDISEAARRLSAQHSISFYDALIVAAALESGCTELLTEDLQTGRRFGGLAVLNPFLGGEG